MNIGFEDSSELRVVLRLHATPMTCRVMEKGAANLASRRSLGNGAGQPYVIV